jgi:serine/threonine protein phosphatase PrpC
MSSLAMMGQTDAGQRRQNNEDAFAVVPDIGLAILADGMGGHQAGEVASAMAIDIIKRSLTARLAQGLRKTAGATPEANAVGEALELANGAIVEAAAANRSYAGMGSTAVVALFHADRVTVGHVGDSRLYRLRAGQLTQLTEDHSMVQELVRRGFLTPEQARSSEQKNIITRALGVDATVQPDVQEHKVREGDLYLLCSDGLHDMVPDRRIEALLRAENQPAAAARQLIAEANARGGEDNVTVVLTRAAKRFTGGKKGAQKLQGLER